MQHHLLNVFWAKTKRKSATQQKTAKTTKFLFYLPRLSRSTKSKHRRKAYLGYEVFTLRIYENGFVLRILRTSYYDYEVKRRKLRKIQTKDTNDLFNFFASFKPKKLDCCSELLDNFINLCLHHTKNCMIRSNRCNNWRNSQKKYCR